MIDRKEPDPASGMSPPTTRLPRHPTAKCEKRKPSPAP